MPGEICYSRFPDYVFKPVARPTQRLSVPFAGEDRVLAPRPLAQFPECSQGCVIQRNMPRATVLALGYEQVLPFKVHAVPGYPPVLLAFPHPGIHGNVQLGKMLREILRNGPPKSSLFIGRMLV